MQFTTTETRGEAATKRLDPQMAHMNADAEMGHRLAAKLWKPATLHLWHTLQ